MMFWGFSLGIECWQVKYRKILIDSKSLNGNFYSFIVEFFCLDKLNISDVRQVFNK